MALINQEKNMEAPMVQPQQAPSGVINGFKALTQVIGREQILEAQMTLQKYKEGKANLEQRIIENEQWYKLRHWECMRKKNAAQQVEPSSGWLFNAIANKHADAMDNFPSPNVLPREEGDKAEAEKLSSILPVVLEQNDFEETYDNVWDYKLKAGTGVYGVFWDGGKMNGLGDISIKKVDILSLFWESGITDIQMSRNLFHVELMDNDLLVATYPQLKDRLGNSTLDLNQYVYDDTVDANNKSAVVDWYYKKKQNGRTVLHYVKYVDDVVLYATENEKQRPTKEVIDPETGKPVIDPETGRPVEIEDGLSPSERGWYDHGQYPFVFDPLFSVEGTPCGFGYIDVGKSAQEYIDRGNQAIMKNMLANARPRTFVPLNSGINEEELADTEKEVIHYEGSPDGIIPARINPLSAVFLNVINSKVDELKEVTGNRDISTGGTTSGVTAASAIAAMQEAGSKLSRDNNKASYRAFRKVCLMVIELIRQFYDIPRCFRIMGENGAANFTEYSNAGISPQFQGIEMGVDMGYKLPLFDIEITAQKQSPYSKMSQNELAIQFYNAGFFNPQMSDQALACLDMMDFDRKQFVAQKIAQNGTMYQQLIQAQQMMLMMAQSLDEIKGTNMAERIAAGITGGAMPTPVMGSVAADKVGNTEALGGKEGPTEASNTKKARQRVAESTDPT